MGRAPRLDCKNCGVIKTPDNCGVRAEKGKLYWQSMCKSCRADMSCIKPNDRGYYEYVIYVFKDTGGTVTYVGSTGYYHRRMIDHRSKGTIHPNEVSYIIETNESLTKEEGTAWAKIQENHYMDIYADTIRNQLASGVYVRPRSVHLESEPHTDEE